MTTEEIKSKVDLNYETIDSLCQKAASLDTELGIMTETYQSIMKPFYAEHESLYMQASNNPFSEFTDHYKNGVTALHGTVFLTIMHIIMQNLAPNIHYSSVAVANEFFETNDFAIDKIIDYINHKYLVNSTSILYDQVIQDMRYLTRPSGTISRNSLVNNKSMKLETNLEPNSRSLSYSIPHETVRRLRSLEILLQIHIDHKQPDKVNHFCLAEKMKKLSYGLIHHINENHIETVEAHKKGTITITFDSKTNAETIANVLAKEFTRAHA